MGNETWSERFTDLSTPLLADACLRLQVPLRVAPPGIRPVITASRIAGGVLPARHYGSVDVFLEAMAAARSGDVLVIDNGGRTDEACIGDLTALEARACGLAGLIVWGLHRDTAELLEIGFPVFSYGSCPAGPQRLDPREPDALRRAWFGDFDVSAADLAFADADGVVFVPRMQAEAILGAARDIQKKERRQAQDIMSGRTLREQLRFDEYLARRSGDASFTFRRHLREIGGEIEE